MDEFDLLFGWLPPDARAAFLAAWTADPTTAWEVVRQDSRYEQWFPGNLTEDGRVRYSEENYAAVIASYDEAFRDIGIDPAYFRSQYGDLIRGEVSPAELAQERLYPMYDRIVSSSQSIRRYYMDTYGIADMTPEAFMAGVLDPNLGERIIARQISIAEIGGEGLESGFAISADFATRLLDADMDRRSADAFFRQAENQIPDLSVLAQRHFDPDDDFDINEFAEGIVFSDPTQLRRMRRFRAQESSLFSNVGAGIRYTQQDSRVSGLASY